MSGGEFAAIEARLAAATQGPWVHPYPECRDIRNYDHEIVVDSFNDGIGAGVIEQSDAEFIAHAREDIPALLAAVRERDNTIARVRAEVEAIDGLSREPLGDDMTSAFNLCLRGLRAALDPQETE